MKASPDVQEFTTNVGIELKSAVLAAIVAAQVVLENNYFGNAM